MAIQVYKPHYTVLDSDYYEATVTKAEEVPNKFYKPEEEGSHPTQVEVEFTVDSGIPNVPDARLKKWFSPTLGEKSFLTAFLRALFPSGTFNRESPTSEQLDPLQWLGKSVRIQVTKEMKDGIERNKIGDITAPKKTKKGKEKNENEVEAPF